MVVGGLRESTRRRIRTGSWSLCWHSHCTIVEKNWWMAINLWLYVSAWSQHVGVRTKVRIWYVEIGALPTPCRCRRAQNQNEENVLMSNKIQWKFVVFSWRFWCVIYEISLFFYCTHQPIQITHRDDKTHDFSSSKKHDFYITFRSVLWVSCQLSWDIRRIKIYRWKTFIFVLMCSYIWQQSVIEERKKMS